MIESKQILSGTEDELLEYFKTKYNLVENTSNSNVETPQSVQTSDPVVEQPKETLPDPTVRKNYPGEGNLFGQKVSTGFSNLFGGTSWGQ
jgi:hypothetical protein